MARKFALLIAGAAALLAAGCGDDDGGAATSGGGGTDVSVASTSAAESTATASTAATPSTGVATSTSTASTGASGAPDAQAYVDAMIQSFDTADPAQLQIDREQAQCLAPRWVDTLGADRLAAAGIQPEDFANGSDPDVSTIGLTEDEGNEMYDAFGACDIDVKKLFVASFTSGRDISEKDRQCLVDAFDEDLLRRILVTTFVNGSDALNQDQELSGDLLKAFGKCPGLNTGGG